MFPTQAAKLWHFDWLCYLRLLGECRSFLSGVTKRGQEGEKDGREMTTTTTTTTAMVEANEDNNNNSNNITMGDYKSEARSIINNDNNSSSVPGPSTMDAEQFKKMANDISDHLANNLNLSYPPNNNNNNNIGGCGSGAASSSEEANFNKLKKNGPMSTADFRRHGKQMVDYIADYLESIHTRRVTPNVEPGYMKNYLPEAAPMKAESWETIMEDFEKIIMPGVTHWQHPRFHAYFPAGNSFPSILADMVTDAIGCVGFSWAASPACTELEIIMLDWVAKIIGLPEEFLCLSDHSSKGGGVIQVSNLTL